MGLPSLPCGIADSDPAGGMDVSLLLSVVCCQVQVSAKGRSLVQRSHLECGVSECDREASIMGCCPMGEKVKLIGVIVILNFRRLMLTIVDVQHR